MFARLSCQCTIRSNKHNINYIVYNIHVSIYRENGIILSLRYNIVIQEYKKENLE